MILNLSSHMTRHMAMFSKLDSAGYPTLANLAPQICERISGHHKWLRDYQKRQCCDQR